MDNRLTRPGIEANPTAARFMGGEVKIQDIGDKVLELILNGPTINGVNKDTLRHLVRQLYTELKCYEDGTIVELEIANETGMMFADEDANHQDKETFVRDLGWLLSQTREQVERCYLDEEEQVHIVFRGGSERKVNVKHDSYAAIIRDVAKAV